MCWERGWQISTLNFRSIFNLRKLNLIFSFSWHNMKLKIALVIPHHKRNWLMTSLTWSRDVFWKGRLVYKLNTDHLTLVMTSHEVSFYQGVLLKEVQPDELYCFKSTTKISALSLYFLMTTSCKLFFWQLPRMI